MSVNPQDEALLTIGELAQACGVTVRTIQHYDECGLLHPTTRCDDGQLLYDTDALNRMKTICLLKDLGLPLETIYEVLESDGSPEVLRALFTEQQRMLTLDLEKRERMLAKLQEQLGSLEQAPTDHQSEFASQPVESTIHAATDAEHNVSSLPAAPRARLRKTQRRMLLDGVIIDAVEVGCIIGGIVTGNWWPLLATLPLTATITADLIRTDSNDTRYVCPHCQSTFNPSLRESLFSSRTPKTRKLTCTSCGVKDWCIEVAAPEE